MGRMKGIGHICYNCSSNTTYIRKDGNTVWYNHNDNWYCEKCNNKLFKNPKWHPINSLRRVCNHIEGKQEYVKTNPRTGVCSICGAIKGIDCERTAIHHIEYDKEDVLLNTIELCASCHAKQKLSHTIN